MSREPVRPFDAEDAGRVAELLSRLSRASVQTGDSLVHRHASEPPRARRRSWVAIEDDEVVGFATAYFRWFGGEAGTGRIWVGVSPERRRGGIGTELWETAAAHLGGAKVLTVEVDDDPAGLRFVEKRGFTQYDSEVMSSLDLRSCDLQPEPQAGFRVLRLAEARDRERDLFEFYSAAGGLRPGDPENQVTLEEWRKVIFETPLLDEEASAIVVDSEGRIASLAWLLVDATMRRAENEWTATLPQLRGRGLARLAKLSSLRWAADRGLVEIVTGNDPDNLPMRELNRRLGYRELFLRRDLDLPTRQ